MILLKYFNALSIAITAVNGSFKAVFNLAIHLKMFRNKKMTCFFTKKISSSEHRLVILKESDIELGKKNKIRFKPLSEM
ncbi:MAG: hypothetical protein ACR2FN_13430 [Chitinophagaceae bacterium]